MHKILKMALVASLTLLFNQAASADPVIELDNKNPVHCIQQLESTKDSYPVVLIYAGQTQPSEIFLPTFEKVSKCCCQKGRGFFQFDISKASTDVAQKCLGVHDTSSLIGPVINVIVQYVKDGQIVRSIPFRAHEAFKKDPQNPEQIVPLSAEDLENAIEIDWHSKTFISRG